MLVYSNQIPNKERFPPYSTCKLYYVDYSENIQRCVVFTIVLCVYEKTKNSFDTEKP